MTHHLKAGDLLLIVDPQNDFMPGGALSVKEGDQIIPVLNRWIAAAQKMQIPIVVSRDWHPPHHISFQERGGKWPVHCVRDTPGADFHPDLHLPRETIIVDKATEKDTEAYSAFEGVTHDTGVPLLDKLREFHIARVWIMGLTLDYCVYYSAIDAAKQGFEFHVVLPGCRAIAADTAEKALAHMRQMGGVILEEEEQI